MCQWESCITEWKFFFGKLGMSDSVAQCVWWDLTPTTCKARGRIPNSYAPQLGVITLPLSQRRQFLSVDWGSSGGERLRRKQRSPVEKSRGIAFSQTGNAGGRALREQVRLLQGKWWGRGNYSEVWERQRAISSKICLDFHLDLFMLPQSSLDFYVTP